MQHSAQRTIIRVPFNGGQPGESLLFSSALHLRDDIRPPPERRLPAICRLSVEQNGNVLVLFSNFIGQFDSYYSKLVHFVCQYNFLTFSKSNFLGERLIQKDEKQ